ncbi:hypothetical protein HOU08_gp069 [Dickeya phage vB_DsoM_JA29]|uniref:Uncharacterized protein n=1 Tax=Dickeya phage vB_DsoM_JA29 TaxID=2283031 RepID=A0A384ZX54_9CAUD|nr:hypothetical protein HOU08_gp069 [Dickeya phage vB_DsoM_JA29]AXG66795.1 hypothetical protein JA29_069 [Dickeya phage vB_DsoM_JA29]
MKEKGQKATPVRGSAKSAPIAPITPATTGSRTTAPARVVTNNENSPIRVLANLSESLATSCGVFHEAMAKVGMYSLGAEGIADRVNDLLSAQNSDVQSYQKEDNSAAATIVYAGRMLALTSAMFEAIVYGVEDSKKACDGEEDREALATDKTFAGRRLSDAYLDACSTSNTARDQLDSISISIFGTEVEIERAASACSDSMCVGVAFMLEAMVRRMDNMLNAVNTLTYRVNESM